jgi:hypothetical protein
MSMLIQPFPGLGATNEGQRVDAGRGSRAATIPERTDQQAGRRRRGHRGGRPPAFDPNTYDKLACHYRAAITLVSTLLWINK